MPHNLCDVTWSLYQSISFYMYCNGRCSSELASRIPPPLCYPRSTRVGVQFAREFCETVTNPRIARWNTSLKSLICWAPYRLLFFPLYIIFLILRLQSALSSRKNGLKIINSFFYASSPLTYNKFMVGEICFSIYFSNFGTIFSQVIVLKISLINIFTYWIRFHRSIFLPIES